MTDGGVDPSGFTHTYAAKSMAMIVIDPA